MKTKIKSAQDLNKLRKMQIAQVMTYLSKMRAKNRRIVEKKFDKHME